MEALGNVTENKSNKSMKKRSNRNRFRRQVENKYKTGKIGRCSDSSSLCKFFHPDHPDAVAATRTYTGRSYKKPMEKMSGPPASCKELNLLGHSLNGLYLINGAGRNPYKVILVNCNFNDIQSKFNSFRNF